MFKIKLYRIRQVFLFLLFTFSSLSAVAQVCKEGDSLNVIIADAHRTPETRILASVYLGEYYINKQKNVAKSSLAWKRGQKLSEVLKYHGTDGELLFLNAFLVKSKSFPDSARHLNNLAITLLRKKEAGYFLGKALLQEAEYLNADNDAQYQEKIRLLKEAITCFVAPQDRWIKAGTLKMLGDFYSIRRDISGNIGLALAAYQNAKLTYSSYGYYSIEDIYIAMAEIYRSLGDNAQGLKFCLLAIQTAEKAGDTTLTMCQIYNHTGMQYISVLDYDNAENSLLRGLVIAERFHDQNSIFSVSMNLYYIYAHKNDFNKIKKLMDRIHAHCKIEGLESRYLFYTLYLRYFTLIKDVDNGRKYCTLLIEMISSADPTTIRHTGSYTYSAISSYLVISHDFQNAHKYWFKAFGATMMYDSTPSNKSKLYLAHYKIDSAKNNLDSALYYLRLYNNSRDASYTSAQAQQAANLKVLYETQKKELELAASQQKVHILSQNGQLQRANLKQAILIRNITTVASVVGLLIGLLLFRMAMLNRKALCEIGKTNKLLEKALIEKEWLFREVHHRVKNNLHTVACLLESEAAYLENGVSKVLDDTRNRIYAMSLIHEKLYGTENLKQLEIDNFANQLINHLRDFYGLGNFINFKVEIPKIELEATVAIPIGLIINEAVTNAIKYAFVNRNQGMILIKLIQVDDTLELSITDNGIGISKDHLKKPPQSMGLRLMYGLCQDIGGCITFNNRSGTEIKMKFNPIIADTELKTIQELLNNIPVRDGI